MSERPNLNLETMSSARTNRIVKVRHIQKSSQKSSHSSSQEKRVDSIMPCLHCSTLQGVCILALGLHSEVRHRNRYNKVSSVHKNEPRFGSHFFSAQHCPISNVKRTTLDEFNQYAEQNIYLLRFRAPETPMNTKALNIN